jgi:hypothetical protein
MAAAFPAEVLIDLLGMVSVEEGLAHQNLSLKQIKAWVVPKIYRDTPTFTSLAIPPFIQ